MSQIRNPKAEHLMADTVLQMIDLNVFPLEHISLLWDIDRS